MAARRVFSGAVMTGSDDLTDRMTMEQIAASAIRIIAAEGERKVQDLKVAK